MLAETWSPEESQQVHLPPEGMKKEAPGKNVIASLFLFQINSELQVPPTQVFRVPTK